MTDDKDHEWFSFHKWVPNVGAGVNTTISNVSQF